MTTCHNVVAVDPVAERAYKLKTSAWHETLTQHSAVHHAGRAWKTAFGDFSTVGSDAVAHAALLQLPLEVTCAPTPVPGLQMGCAAPHPIASLADNVMLRA